MKKATLAVALVAVLSLTACGHGGTWTPQGAGRTAGEGHVEQVRGNTADSTFSGSLRK